MRPTARRGRAARVANYGHGCGARVRARAPRPARARTVLQIPAAARTMTMTPKRISPKLLGKWRMYSRFESALKPCGPGGARRARALPSGFQRRSRGRRRRRRRRLGSGRRGRGRHLVYAEQVVDRGRGAEALEERQLALHLEDLSHSGATRSASWIPFAGAQEAAGGGGGWQCHVPRCSSPGWRCLRR